VTLDPVNIGLIITTLITVLAGWASQRSASKTSRAIAKEQVEHEAYSRARAMDDKTIARQNEEIEDLTADNKQLRADKRALEIQLAKAETIKRALINRNMELQDQAREKKNDQQDI